MKWADAHASPRPRTWRPGDFFQFSRALTRTLTTDRSTGGAQTEGTEYNGGNGGLWKPELPHPPVSGPVTKLPLSSAARKRFEEAFYYRQYNNTFKMILSSL